MLPEALLIFSTQKQEWGFVTHLSVEEGSSKIIMKTTETYYYLASYSVE